MTRRRILLPLLLAALFCACAPSRRTAAVHSRAENDLRMQVLREELSTRDSLFFRALCEELIRNLDGERHLHRVVGEDTGIRHLPSSRYADRNTAPAAGDHPTAAPYGFHSRGGPCTTDRTPNPGRHDPRRRSCQAAASDGRKYLPAGSRRNRSHDGPASRPYLVAACPVHCRTAGRGLWHLQIIQTPLKQQLNGKKQSYRKNRRESSENGRSLRPDRGRVYAGRERIARSPAGSRHGTRRREGGGTDAVGPRSSGHDTRSPAGLRIR